MVAKKKTSSVDNINARLSLVVKSGKISLGHRTTIKALRKSQGPPQHRAAGSGCALPRVANCLCLEMNGNSRSGP